MKIKKFSGNKRSLKLEIKKLINSVLIETIVQDGTDLKGHQFENEYFYKIDDNELSMMSYEDFSKRIDAFKDYLKNEPYYNDIIWSGAYLQGSNCNSFGISDISINAPKNTGDTDGEISVTVSGGTIPYYFSIYNSNQTYENTNNMINTNSYIFKNLTGNTLYYIYVEDSNGCFNLTEDLEVPFGCGDFSVRGYSFPPTNQTNDNGEATIYLGKRDVSKTVYYEWRTGSSTNPTIIGYGNMINGNSFTITKLHQNTKYYVTVTANTSCVMNTQIDVGATIVGCNNKYLDIDTEPAIGEKLGTATVTVVGASAPFTYIWESGYTGGNWTEIESTLDTYDTTNTVTNLPINGTNFNYQVRVLDVDTCDLNEGFIITDGTLYEGWAGASKVYDYVEESSNMWSEQWTPPLFTKNTNFYNYDNDMGLAYKQFYTYGNGIYTPFNPGKEGYVSLVAKRDGVGVVYTFNIGSDGKILSANPSLSRPINEYVLQQTIDKQPTTNNSKDGKVTVKIYNGTSNYNYAWKIDNTINNEQTTTNSTYEQTTTNSTQNINVCSSLQRGVNYYVTATDSSNPVKTFKTKVYFNPISNYLSLENIEAINSTNNLNNGRIIVTLKNGTPPFKYNVNNGFIAGTTGTTSFTLNNLEGDKVYTIDITDNNDTTIQTQIEVKKDTYTMWYGNSNLFASDSTACSAWKNQQTYYIKNYELNQPYQSPSLGGRYLYIKDINGNYISPDFSSYAPGYLALRNCPSSSCYGLVYEISANGYITLGPPDICRR